MREDSSECPEGLHVDLGHQYLTEPLSLLYGMVTRDLESSFSSSFLLYTDEGYYKVAETFVLK